MSLAFSAVAAAGASGLAFFSHHMLFQATYLNGHVIAAALILGFFSAPRAIEGNDSAVAVQAVCVTGIVFLRLEGVLVGILMVATQSCLRDGRPRSRTILAGTVACAATLYQGGVLLVSHPVANFASLIDPTLAWALIAAAWLFFAGTAMIDVLGWARVARRLPGLTLAGLALAIAGLALAKPGHMLLVIVNVCRNLLWAGGWGPTWIVLWIGFLGGLLIHRNAPRAPGVLFSVGYVLLVIALGGLNAHPYRSPGFLDSGNRMMVHILPLMCWVVVCCWLAGINAGLESRHRRAAALE
jgi:hypothetical protein